jgi:hypothetical protein
MSYHGTLREKAGEYGLTTTQLNAICQVTHGAPFTKISEEQARFLLTIIIARGAESTAAWGKELEGSL